MHRVVIDVATTRVEQHPPVEAVIEHLNRTTLLRVDPSHARRQGYRIIVDIDPTVEEQRDWMTSVRGLTMGQLTFESDGVTVSLDIDVLTGVTPTTLHAHLPLLPVPPEKLDQLRIAHDVAGAAEVAVQCAALATARRYIDGPNPYVELLEVHPDEAAALCRTPILVPDLGVVTFTPAFTGRAATSRRRPWRLRYGSPVFNCDVDVDEDAGAALLRIPTTYTARIAICPSLRPLTDATIEYLCRRHAQKHVHVEQLGDASTRCICCLPEDEEAIYDLTERIHLAYSGDVAPFSSLYPVASLDNVGTLP